MDLGLGVGNPAPDKPETQAAPLPPAEPQGTADHQLPEDDQDDGVSLQSSAASSPVDGSQEDSDDLDTLLGQLCDTFVLCKDAVADKAGAVPSSWPSHESAPLIMGLFAEALTLHGRREELSESAQSQAAQLFKEMEQFLLAIRAPGFTQCAGVSKDKGVPCRNLALDQSVFCGKHKSTCALAKFPSLDAMGQLPPVALSAPCFTCRQDIEPEGPSHACLQCRRRAHASCAENAIEKAFPGQVPAAPLVRCAVCVAMFCGLSALVHAGRSGISREKAVRVDCHPTLWPKGLKEAVAASRRASLSKAGSRASWDRVEALKSALLKAKEKAPESAEGAPSGQEASFAFQPQEGAGKGGVDSAPQAPPPPGRSGKVGNTPAKKKTKRAPDDVEEEEEWEEARGEPLSPTAARKQNPKASPFASPKKAPQYTKEPSPYPTYGGSVGLDSAGHFSAALLPAAGAAASGAATPLAASSAEGGHLAPPSLQSGGPLYDQSWRGGPHPAAAQPGAAFGSGNMFGHAVPGQAGLPPGWGGPFNAASPLYAGNFSAVVPFGAGGVNPFGGGGPPGYFSAHPSAAVAAAAFGGSGAGVFPGFAAASGAGGGGAAAPAAPQGAPHSGPPLGPGATPAGPQTSAAGGDADWASKLDLIERQIQALQTSSSRPPSEGTLIDTYLCPRPTIHLVDPRTGRCLDGCSPTQSHHPDYIDGALEDFDMLGSERPLCNRRRRLDGTSGSRRIQFSEDGQPHAVGQAPDPPETLILGEEGSKQVTVLAGSTAKFPPPSIPSHFQYLTYCRGRFRELSDHALLRYQTWLAMYHRGEQLSVETCNWLLNKWNLILATYIFLVNAVHVLVNEFALPFPGVIKLLSTWVRDIWVLGAATFAAPASTLMPLLKLLPEKLYLCPGLEVEGPSDRTPSIRQAVRDVLKPFCSLKGVYPQSSGEHNPHGAFYTFGVAAAPRRGSASGASSAPGSGAASAAPSPAAKGPQCQVCARPVTADHAYSRTKGYFCWNPCTCACPHCNFLHCFAGPRMTPCGEDEPQGWIAKSRAVYMREYPLGGKWLGLPPPPGLRANSGPGRPRGQGRGRGGGGGRPPQAPASNPAL